MWKNKEGRNMKSNNQQKKDKTETQDVVLSGYTKQGQRKNNNFECKTAQADNQADRIESEDPIDNNNSDSINNQICECGHNIRSHCIDDDTDEIKDCFYEGCECKSFVPKNNENPFYFNENLKKDSGKTGNENKGCGKRFNLGSMQFVNCGVNYSGEVYLCPECKKKNENHTQPDNKIFTSSREDEKQGSLDACESPENKKSGRDNNLIDKKSVEDILKEVMNIIEVPEGMKLSVKWRIRKAIDLTREDERKKFDKIIKEIENGINEYENYWIKAHQKGENHQEDIYYAHKIELEKVKKVILEIKGEKI